MDHAFFILGCKKDSPDRFWNESQRRWADKRAEATLYARQDEAIRASRKVHRNGEAAPGVAVRIKYLKVEGVPRAD
ncbi:hypothetical protein [Paracoccus sp. MKU1]|uniref:hypothetical protein n=1 Tax=Paracoccus sp. MKU1 TaxID=1745182 RepID=UPI000719459C|nr:hypothetical protein [Paracoccus sp. MKU1]KRW94329.1 hypothetical protein AQY21_20585 [Paracoccus sp. MKU1]